jgi:hypothetical protein
VFLTVVLQGLSFCRPERELFWMPEYLNYPTIAVHATLSRPGGGFALLFMKKSNRLRISTFNLTWRMKGEIA